MPIPHLPISVDDKSSNFSDQNLNHFFTFVPLASYVNSSAKPIDFFLKNIQLPTSYYHDPSLVQANDVLVGLSVFCLLLPTG